jgi:hypothetical protein
MQQPGTPGGKTERAESWVQCKQFKLCQKFLGTAFVDEDTASVDEDTASVDDLLTSSSNRCYCKSCAENDPAVREDAGGNLFEIPRGWCGFGVKLPPRAKTLDIFNSWSCSFHGCGVNVLQSILKEGQLLMPGDVLLDGTKLPNRATAGSEDRIQVYTSPSYHYSALPIYASTVPFEGKNARVMLLCRQNQGFGECGETIGWTKRFGTSAISPNFPNDKIERFTRAKNSIIVTKILIRVDNDVEREAEEEKGLPLLHMHDCVMYTGSDTNISKSEVGKIVALPNGDGAYTAKFDGKRYCIVPSSLARAAVLDSCAPTLSHPTSSTITISWAKPPTSALHVRVYLGLATEENFSYVDYDTKRIKTSAQSFQDIPAAETSITVVALKPNSKYTCMYKLLNGTGLGRGVQACGSTLSENWMAAARARGVKAISLTGQQEGDPQHMCMHVYELIEGKEVNGRGVWRTRGSCTRLYYENAFLYYSSTSSWCISDEDDMEEGKSSGWMTVRSTALTPDKATETWRVAIGEGVFVDAPAVAANALSKLENALAMVNIKIAYQAEWEQSLQRWTVAREGLETEEELKARETSASAQTLYENICRKVRTRLCIFVFKSTIPAYLNAISVFSGRVQVVQDYF